MLKTDLETHFGTSDCYKILGVEKTAGEGQIKKAYYKLSLKLHPDRQQSDKETFTLKFQLISQIHTILSDKKKRHAYDEDGSLDCDHILSSKDGDEWMNYWRNLYQKVTLEDILEFEKKYKGSEEETEDVKNAYISSKGNMDEIMNMVMLVTFDEESRIRNVIEELIKTKQVKKFKAFTEETSSKRKRRERKGKKEEKEALESRKELGLDGSEESLMKAIAMRQKDREQNMNSFFDSLEAKYAQPAKKRKKHK